MRHASMGFIVTSEDHTHDNGACAALLVLMYFANLAGSQQ
jgi:hypothetical protein